MEELDALIDGLGKAPRQRAATAGKKAKADDGTFSPMLAAKVEPEDFPKLRFPVMLSPKLDGIRMTGQSGRLLSRTLKMIPNRFTQARFGREEYHLLDGEAIVGDPTHPNVCNLTDSAVMSHAGEPDITWYLFDAFGDAPFIERHAIVGEMAQHLPHVKVVPHTLVHSLEAMMEFEDRCLAEGYEGICGRDPNGPYKQGRSTLNQGWLWKFKRFLDSEAVVVGVEELMHNDNPAEIDERGYTKRSRCQDLLTPAGCLGKLMCVDDKLFPGHVLKVGTGFSQAERDALWAIRDRLPGATLKYGYTPIGIKDKPRFPKFLGWRSKLDR